MENKIKAVLFDFDNTLADRTKAAYRSYSHYLDEQKIDTKGDIYYREAIIQDLMTWDQFGNANKKWIIRNLNEKYGTECDEEAFVDWWFENHPKYEYLFPKTEQTLQYLAKKYRLGIITNGRHKPQSAKIENTGVGKYMDVIVISGDYNTFKPDKALFEIACQKLNLKPEECVYVGDTYANDIYGAKRAGMDTIWIWPDDRMTLESQKRIFAIEELMQIL